MESDLLAPFKRLKLSTDKLLFDHDPNYPIRFNGDRICLLDVVVKVIDKNADTGRQLIRRVRQRPEVDNCLQIEQIFPGNGTSKAQKTCSFKLTAS